MKLPSMRPGKYLPTLVGLMLIAALLIVPTGFEEAAAYRTSERCRARVTATNEDSVLDTGLIRSGQQTCDVEIISGSFEGRRATGVNLLTGSMDTDKIYVPGDVALVSVNFSGDEIVSVSMIDHYRLDKMTLLALAFVAVLLVVSGASGMRAIVSFAVSMLAIWKVLLPLYLKGVNPIVAGLMVTCLLTMVIISLVYGFDRRFLAATSGALLGVITTSVMGVVFTGAFGIHGAVMPGSESLLYAGFAHLSLTRIYMASIYIGASGAIMDLAVDITSSVHEVVAKKPEIGRLEAMRSGMNVGRAAMGTMTTTLLLAYSGSYITMLMVFMAQGTPIISILNHRPVAAAILETIVGSFGLVTVAPFTALSSALLLTGRRGGARQ